MEIAKHYFPKETEQKWSKFWEKNEIYRFSSKNKGEVYSVDTPPPYVSADHLHVGHAMSYTQAEVIVRFRRMLGDNVFYPMGFDDNGLPTERHVEKKYNVDKSKITRQEFVDLCIKETKEGGKVYQNLWSRLGLSVDWSLLYNTISPEAQRVAQLSFIDLFKKDRIYRLDSPVHWCPYCHTALAQADLEDKEEKSVMYDIQFGKKKDPRLIVATTRPELLFACVALYVNPEDTRYSDLVGKKVEVPLTDNSVTIKTHPKVEMDKGTGLMMVCTWGDQNDVEKWKSDKLESRIIFDQNGIFNDLAGKFKGKRVRESRPEIVAELKENGLLISENPILHNISVHERCKNPVEFLSSSQWYIKILDLKKELLERGDQLNWYPASMKIHYTNWVEGLGWDWCISRDRFFGVPFPVWHCEDCGEIILPQESELPVDPREAEKPESVKKCRKCGSEKITGEMQVMDTWMTSSVTPLINAKWKGKSDLTDTIYPMSLRVQALEIIRTWLFYSVVKSHLHTDSLPWKSVMISGHGTDAKGEKMSKSVGNFVVADKVIDQYGADALRLWACNAGLGANVRYSEEDVRSGQKFLTKLWNVSRFVFMNLENMPEEPKKLHPTDAWIREEVKKLISDSTADLLNYEFGLAKIKIEKFFWTKLTDNYLELIKGRLYGEEGELKQSAQATLVYLLDVFCHLLAPFVPFITEEIYQQFFLNKKYSEKSIHMRPWPKEDGFEAKLIASGDSLIESIEAIRKYKAQHGIKLNEDLTGAVFSGSTAWVESLKPFESDIKNVGRIKDLSWKEIEESEPVFEFQK